MVADVLGGPPLAERLAARGQLADEVADGSVVRVASGFGAQRGDQVLGGFLPVGEELLCRGVQEGEARGVGRLLTAVEQRRVQRAAERVGRQVVVARVVVRRGGADRVEDALDHRPDPVRARALASPAGYRSGGEREVEQVGALGVVELKG